MDQEDKQSGIESQQTSLKRNQDENEFPVGLTMIILIE